MFAFISAVSRFSSLYDTMNTMLIQGVHFFRTLNKNNEQSAKERQKNNEELLRKVPWFKPRMSRWEFHYSVHTSRPVPKLWNLNNQWFSSVTLCHSLWVTVLSFQSCNQVWHLISVYGGLTMVKCLWFKWVLGALVFKESYAKHLFFYQLVTENVSPLTSSDRSALLANNGCRQQ